MTRVEPADAFSTSAPPGALRRRSSYLYGLIISGAVLATAGQALRLAWVGAAVFGTLVIYWAAETYVHWMAARSVHGRDLTREERLRTVRDGWPLVTAGAIPVTVLFVEAGLGVENGLAIRVTLAVNAVLLFVVGWAMSRASGLRGVRLVLSAAASGVLGLGMIALKTTLH